MKARTSLSVNRTYHRLFSYSFHFFYFSLDSKMRAAKSGETPTLFSPCFVTSKHGYRLSASVCLNGDGKGVGSHMSVFICILKGKCPRNTRYLIYNINRIINDSRAKGSHIIERERSDHGEEVVIKINALFIMEEHLAIQLVSRLSTEIITTK